jgi:hypothetical protein
MRMFRLSFSLAAALCICFAVRVPAAAVPMSYDEPSGSYQDTCVSITMQGQYLYAKCQDINGNWHQTQLDMDQCPGGLVANNNGTLACGPGGYGIGNGLARGSWRASCRNASQDGSTLYAECNNGSGGWNETSLDMDNCPSRIVDNSRGNLVCSGGSGYGLPRGSWRSSCRNGSMQGPVVFAECNTGYGNWQQTSFDMNRCPVGALGNTHGNLVCESVGYLYRRLQ